MNTQDQLDVCELTISKFHSSLRGETTTCVRVVSAYLDRIAQFNPVLNALICLDPNVLDKAAEKDIETQKLIQESKEFPPLHGVPIVLKDNYTTKDLPTSAGVKALATLQTSQDSESVSHLKSAGAIILAKANLHEFALHGTTTSSLGGQTLNPYDLERTPGGSSGGTAVALAANLGLIGCGTDTMNSLRSPASACAIVGFRPSRGHISTQGIVPVSRTQDAAGPMARTVRDAAVVYNAMRGVSGTVFPPQSGHFTVGILDIYFGLEDTDNCEADIISENKIAQDIIQEAISKIQRETKIVFVPVKPDQDWGVETLLSTADTQPFEFKQCLDSFLQSSFISSSEHGSLESILASGAYHQTAVTEVLTAARDNPRLFSLESQEYQSRQEAIEGLKLSVDRCFDKYKVDALIYPHQRQLPVPIGAMRQPRRNGVLAALTGNPAVCIPGKLSSIAVCH